MCFTARGPQPMGHGPLPGCSLLATGPWKWLAGVCTCAHTLLPLALAPAALLHMRAGTNGAASARRVCTAHLCMHEWGRLCCCGARSAICVCACMHTNLKTALFPSGCKPEKVGDLWIIQSFVELYLKYCCVLKLLDNGYH